MPACHNPHSVTVAHGPDVTLWDLQLTKFQHRPALITHQMCDVATGACPRSGMSGCISHVAISLDACDVTYPPAPTLTVCYVNNVTFLQHHTPGS